MCCSVLVATFPTRSSSVVAMSSCYSDIEINHNIQRLVMQYHLPQCQSLGWHYLLELPLSSAHLVQ